MLPASEKTNHQLSAISHHLEINHTVNCLLYHVATLPLAKETHGPAKALKAGLAKTRWQAARAGT
jgi:hypothetical protein